MKPGNAVKLLTNAAAVLAISAMAATVNAQQIVVSNYGVSANGMPYAVAMDKGYFKEEGANVTGILTSAGGGTTLRNMLAGDVPYGEVNPNVVAAAAQQGVDIRIIAGTVLTVAEFAWVVKPDSPIKSVKDLKGKKFGYTNPRSTSQALATLIIESGGLKTSDVELVKTGGFGEGVAALDIGQIDVAALPEPLWSKFGSKYRVIAKASDLLPPLANVVGVTIGGQTAEKSAFIRAVIRARRRAVAFMHDKPDEAAAIIAKVYKIELPVAINTVRNLTTSVTAGVPYWGAGQIHLDGLKRTIDIQKQVGALNGDIDISKSIDTSFLPDDLKTVK
ncbi:MAG: ABC transporter substrate-binding protein [Hyphomicrobiaceae bacterium]